MVGGVVWVCHDDDIVAHIVITHGVVAYDDTVMSAPVYVIDNDVDACLDIIDDKLGELPTTYLAIGVLVVLIRCLKHSSYSCCSRSNFFAFLRSIGAQAPTSWRSSKEASLWAERPLVNCMRF